MDKIIQEMSRIYSMFCWPRGILNTETREITFENICRNSDAEAYYNTLAEILKTQQAAQPGVQPTADHAVNDTSRSS